jgi:hypothetical protein
MNPGKAEVKFGEFGYRLDAAAGLSLLMYDLNLIGLIVVPKTAILLPLYVFFGAIGLIFGLWFLVAGLMIATGQGHKIKFTITRPKKK